MSISDMPHIALPHEADRRDHTILKRGILIVFVLATRETTHKAKLVLAKSYDIFSEQVFKEPTSATTQRKDVCSGRGPTR
jgi:hypothetical protein